jgi:hypothetical protein
LLPPPRQPLRANGRMKDEIISLVFIVLSSFLVSSPDGRRVK